MSDLGVDELASGQRTRHKHGRGCVAVVVAIAVIVALGIFAYVKGVELVQGALSGLSAPEDYSGDGQGSVTVEVREGDTSSDIAATLYDAGVVKSAEAFEEEAIADSRSLDIQPGVYRLREEMSARSALLLLLDPDAKVTNLLTIPEGLRAKEIVARIADETDFSKREATRAYAKAGSLGLPRYADGDPEGYLFPSTYDVSPRLSAVNLLRLMVEQFEAEARDVGVGRGTKALGVTPGDIVTVASLVQAEARRPRDMPKVASVIYNRLDQRMPLQMDSTLHYAVDSRGEVVAGRALREIDSPYNTYQRRGLPPTPINSPGATALEAAAHPADSDYRYFVTVNLRTGATKFAGSYSDHLRNVDQYQEYCQTSDEC